MCYNAHNVEEVEANVILPNTFDIVLGSPYLYKKDVIFIKRANKHHGSRMESNTSSRDTKKKQKMQW